MNDDELVQWLNDATGSQITTLKDASSGMEICLALSDLADDKKAKKKITNGKTLEEKKNNFQVAANIFERLGISFNYDITKLAKGDRTELRSLLQEIISLTTSGEEQGEEDVEEEVDIDGLISILENDLAEKLESANSLSQELDDVAEERDFLFEKLRKIEKECDEYQPADSEAIRKIIALTSADFYPAKE